jgi:hypothetical protein
VFHDSPFGKVVEWIKKNWKAFMTGKLQRPSFEEKDTRPVYNWFCHHKNNDAQKDLLCSVRN